MAKRFGRNQKRRLKQAVDSLTRDNHSLVLKNSQLESRLINWARSMNHYLGSYHPLNERIHRMMVDRSPHVYERYRFMENRVPSIREMDYALGDMATTLRYIETVLHVIEVYRSDISPEIIVELISSDNKHYFAIDEHYLKNGRKDPKFIHYLSEEIAHSLSDHISQ